MAMPAPRRCHLPVHQTLPHPTGELSPRHDSLHNPHHDRSPGLPHQTQLRLTASSRPECLGQLPRAPWTSSLRSDSAVENAAHVCAKDSFDDRIGGIDGKQTTQLPCQIVGHGIGAEYNLLG